MFERIRRFLNCHPVLDWVLSAMVLLGTSVVFLSFLNHHVSKNQLSLWFTALEVGTLGFYFSYIRPSAADRVTELSPLFNLLRWVQAIILLGRLFFGQYTRGTHQLVTVAILKLPVSEAIWTIAVGLGLTLLWQSLYWLSKKYQWQIGKKSVIEARQATLDRKKSHQKSKKRPKKRTGKN